VASAKRHSFVSQIRRAAAGVGVITLTGAVASALAVLAVAVSGCAGSTRHKESPGVVAGFAVPCIGVFLPSSLQVRVSATEHGHTVATVVAKYRKDRGYYRLVLPPGHYVITARGAIEPPRSVVLRAREHVRINFPNYCK
jgi:hypothetical protein